MYYFNRHKAMYYKDCKKFIADMPKSERDFLFSMEYNDFIEVLGVMAHYFPVDFNWAAREWAKRN